MTITSQYPKLTVEAITEWENKNITIPEPYKVFLLKHNGGSTGDKNTFKVPKMTGEFGFHEFFGIHEGLGGLDYIQTTYTTRNRFPKHYFPIASDVTDNLILMGQNEKKFGEIFFWYHENEVSENEKPWEKNIYKIANDLNNFIENLYEETIVSYGQLSDIYDGDDAGIKALLATEWQVDTPDETGETLIKRAVLHEKVWLIKELIARKADLSGTIENAMTYNNLDILEYLLQAGADTEERNLSDNTSLQEAVMRNSPEVVALLLKYGADKTVVNSNGRSPLEIALFKKNKGIDIDEIIQLLSE